jgi:hypothetical protein
MYGSDKKVPKNGSCRRKVITTGKKSLNKPGKLISRVKWNAKVDAAVPEQIQKSKCFHNHPNEWPFKKY